MGSQFGGWARPGGVAAGRGLALFGLSLLAVLLAVALTVTASSVVWVFLVPAVVTAIRKLANRSRRLAGEWAGVRIPVPYRPPPQVDDGARERRWRRWRWILTDPATWRDLLWLLVAPFAGACLALLPAAVVAYGLFGLVQPAVWKPMVDAGGDNWYGVLHVDSPLSAWSAAVLGAGFVLLGVRIGPWALRIHALVTHWLLGPSSGAALALRVRHLTETRSDAVDAQAAELRRIERDLLTARRPGWWPWV